jgi:WD40 repeat protein
MQSTDFQFAQTLKVHSSAVRTVSTSPFGEVLISGSIDKTNKLYTLNSDSGKYEFSKEVQYHDGFVVSTCSM